METTVYDAFLGTVFKRIRLRLSTLETMRFQKAPILKPFSKAFVFISVFGRFSVDGRQKRIKRYAFSHEKALVRSGPQNSHETLNTYHQG